jgi:ubiquinone/menaquinone biosynthesis C-methylase UbiE
MEDNLEEYADPLNYDAEYGNFEPQGPFFLSYAKQCKGSILDLACGTGKFTIPIAKLGLPVVGVDICEPMLELAKKKSLNFPIEWCSQDARSMEFGQKFKLIIMGGNAFQAFLTKEDQKAMLTNVKNHLDKDGIFIFGTRNPISEDLQNEINKPEYWHSFVDYKGVTVEVYGKQKYDAKEEIVTYTTIRKWPSYTKETEIKLKFTSKRSLVKLLEESGFEVLELYGSYNKERFEIQSDNIIVVCKTASLSK